MAENRRFMNFFNMQRLFAELWSLKRGHILKKISQRLSVLNHKLPWANLIFSCDEDFSPPRILYIIWFLLATFRQIFRINFTYLPETEMPTHLIFRYQWHWHVVWRPLGPLGPPPPLSYWDPWPKVCNKRRSINYFWTSAKYVKHVSHWGKFKTYGLAGGIFFVRGKKIWVFCLLLYFADVKRRTRFGYFFYRVIQSPSFVPVSVDLRVNRINAL